MSAAEYALRSALDGARFEARQHAEEVARLRDENERLRKALTLIAKHGTLPEPCGPKCLPDAIRTAREALTA